MKKLLNCLIILVFITGTAHTQVQTENPNQEQKNQFITVKHLFGASASSVSGVGLSYMYFINPNYHLKITGFPYQNRTEVSNSNNEQAFNNTVWINGGLELRRNFAVINKTKVTYQFYTLAGGSYWYSEKERPFDPGEDKLRKWYTAGLGIGFGFVFINRISLNIDLCYQYSHWIGYDKRYAGPGIGTSCYFAF